MNVLIDTCIIIDALQSREPFAKDAQEIFLLSANNIFSGFITAKSSSDIYYLMHRCTHSDKDSRAVLSKLFTLFGVLDTNGIDCQKAILSKMGDYEDAIMNETALRTEMDCIVTRNISDYAAADVPVYTPRDLIEKLNQEI